MSNANATRGWLQRHGRKRRPHCGWLGPSFCLPGRAWAAIDVACFEKLQPLVVLHATTTTGRPGFATATGPARVRSISRPKPVASFALRATGDSLQALCILSRNGPKYNGFRIPVRALRRRNRVRVTAARNCVSRKAQHRSGERGRREEPSPFGRRVAGYLAPGPSRRRSPGPLIMARTTPRVNVPPRQPLRRAIHSFEAAGRRRLSPGPRPCTRPRCLAAPANSGGTAAVDERACPAGGGGIRRPWSRRACPRRDERPPATAPCYRPAPCASPTRTLGYRPRPASCP